MALVKEYPDMNEAVTNAPVAQAAAAAPVRRSRLEVRAIQGALPIVARQVGRRTDVEVIIGPYSPHRSGKQIFLPALPLDDEGLETVAFGYLLHEAAHVRYDGPAVVKSALQERLRNVLQDPVDERLLGVEFPGYARRLRQLITKLVKDGQFAAPEETSSPLVKLETYMLYRLRAVLLGQQALTDYAKRAEELARAALSAGVCTKIGSIMGRVPSLRTRQDVADLALEVLDVIQKESEEPPPPPIGDPDRSGDPASGAQAQTIGDAADPTNAGPDKQQSPVGARDAADSNPSAGATEDPRPVPIGDADRAGDPASGSQAQTTENPAGPTNVGSDKRQSPVGGDDAADSVPPSDPSEPATTPEQRENLRQVLQAPEGEFGQDYGQVLSGLLESNALPAAEEGLSAGVGRAGTPLGNPHEDPATVLAEVEATTIALKERMWSKVEATRVVREGYRRTGVQIAPRRLVRSQLGDPKVFKRRRVRTEAETHLLANTAVSILLDRSSSMRRRLPVAMRCVLAAAIALQKIRGVAVSAAAFPGHHSGVELLTGFGESVKRTVPRYCAVTASGGTPMVEAMLWAIDALLARPERRKILLVASDGDPSQPDLCRQIAERSWSGGIEAYGIGISAPEIQKIFPVSRCLETVQELASTTFELLQQSLTRPTSA
jgi:cobaltochelatase CobT